MVALNFLSYTLILCCGNLSAIIATETPDNSTLAKRTNASFNMANEAWARSIVADPMRHLERYNFAMIALDAAYPDHPELARDLLVYIGDSDLVGCLIVADLDNFDSITSGFIHFLRDNTSIESAENRELLAPLLKISCQSDGRFAPIFDLAVQSDRLDIITYALALSLCESIDPVLPLQRLASITEGDLCKAVLKELLLEEPDNGMNHLLNICHLTETDNAEALSEAMSLMVLCRRWALHRHSLPPAVRGRVPESEFALMVDVVDQEFNPLIYEVFLQAVSKLALTMGKMRKVQGFSDRQVLPKRF